MTRKRESSIAIFAFLLLRTEFAIADSKFLDGSLFLDLGVWFVFKKITDGLKHWRSKNNPVEYWNKRVKKHGRRAVLNLGHKDNEFDAITTRQKLTIYPYFRQSLNGTEKLLLDYGCGPGRFTVDLANMLSGRAIGVDIIQPLLEMAPTSERVEYRVLDTQTGVTNLPWPDGSFDVVWICLVMGGLPAEAFAQAIVEICRVLRSGGLLFLVENTAQKPDSKHWRFLPVEAYQAAFNFVELRHLQDYEDCGEKISIMAGRKRHQTP